MNASGIGVPRAGKPGRALAAFAYDSADYLGLVTALVAMSAVFAALSPYFLTGDNLLAIGIAVSVTAILAAAQTVVLVSGAIDLSFAAILALAGIAAQRLLELGLPLSIVIVAVLGAGIVCGLVNAVVVVGVGVNPLIATIGTSFAFRGICFIWLAGEQLPYFEDTPLNFIADGQLIGVPFPIVLSVVTIVAVWLIMRVTRFGHRVKGDRGERGRCPSRRRTGRAGPYAGLRPQRRVRGTRGACADLPQRHGVPRCRDR